MSNGQIVDDTTSPPRPRSVIDYWGGGQPLGLLQPFFPQLPYPKFGRGRACAYFHVDRGNSTTHPEWPLPRHRGIDPVEFGGLDVPLAILAASTGYFPGFDRTQDRGFVQSSGRRGRCKAVCHGCSISLRWWWREALQRID
jgi:hypothetical protein